MRKSLLNRRFAAASILAFSLGFAPTAFGQTGTTGQPGQDTTRQPSPSTQDEGMGEATGQYMDDAAITTKVKAALLANTTLKSLGISVETTEGVVHLTGDVSSNAQKSEAERVAKSVKGVKSVDNRLTVKSR
jgi:osmotically-inducible protein OsmY